MAENELERLRDRIGYAWDIARQFGLDPFPTHFELVPATIMYEFASYSLPGRFSHWTHGKAYYRQKMFYDLGLSKIYEMVVNTNPSYAFLMEMNDLLQNTFVAAHVFGHTDFFKNNIYFQHTSRRMIEKASINAERIAKYEFDHGKLEVEHFLDAALSIQEHVDYHLFLKGEEEEDNGATGKEEGRTRPTTAYEDLWALDREERERRAAEERERRRGRPAKFPEKPQKDLLLFLSRHSPALEPWQRDILEIVRQEFLYFVPQMQTKVMNEGWACVTREALILTDRGLLHADELHRLLESGAEIAVGSGGGQRDRVTDRHLRRNAATVRIQTRRGLVLEGAEGHKLNIGPGQWLELKDVRLGQRLPLCVGDNVWPEQPVALAPTGAREEALVGATQARAAGRPASRPSLVTTTPTCVDAALATLLGYLVSAGSIAVSSARIAFVTQQRALAEGYARLAADLFSVQVEPRRAEQEAGAAGERWQVVFSSAQALDLLERAGITLQTRTSHQHLAASVPGTILRSPRRIVSAFLRACCDCTGCVSLETGVTLTSGSEEVARSLQILLLNYGILSERTGTQVRIEGAAAQRFAQEIGFGLAEQQERLQAYLAQSRPVQAEEPFDEVVRIEHGMADVYDITVARSHCYVANGMLHHNSIWHSRIMREMADRDLITSAEVLEFAQMHSSVLSPSRTSLNPYYLGFKIFEDIERRWNNPTKEEQERLGRRPGQGLQKIFEVRELDNDVSFLRNYLTKELIEDLDLYLYKKEGDEWVIVEKNWEKVRDGIVASMTNFGYPYLVVDDGDYRGNRELYLKHLHEGQDLDLVYAEKTLQYVYQLWGRPVHLETIYDGKRILLSYDGERNSKSTLER